MTRELELAVQHLLILADKNVLRQELAEDIYKVIEALKSADKAGKGHE